MRKSTSKNNFLNIISMLTEWNEHIDSNMMQVNWKAKFEKCVCYKNNEHTSS